MKSLNPVLSVPVTRTATCFGSKTPYAAVEPSILFISPFPFAS
jgi:hypothetical protein